MSSSQDVANIGLPRLHFLYHEIRQSKSDYSYVVTAQQFSEHLSLLGRNASASNLLPEFTFDDGHVSNVEVALPILSSHEVKATFFITAGWTASRASYMNWSQLRLLQDAGHHIGAHGWSHALLTRCNDAELDRELRSARLLLQDKLGSPITSMSFPGGRYDQRVVKACLAAGYTRLYTSEPQIYSSGLLAGRLNVRGSMTADSLLDLLRADSPALKSVQRQYRLKSSAQRLLGDRLYASLWSLLNRKEPDTDATGQP